MYYIIINRTTGINNKVSGSFPSQIAEEMLNKGDEIVIVSRYSDTIKVPYIVTEWNTYGKVEWEWKDYELAI